MVRVLFILILNFSSKGECTNTNNKCIYKNKVIHIHGIPFAVVLGFSLNSFLSRIPNKHDVKRDLRIMMICSMDRCHLFSKRLKILEIHILIQRLNGHHIKRRIISIFEPISTSSTYVFNCSNKY